MPKKLLVFLLIASVAIQPSMAAQDPLHRNTKNKSWVTPTLITGLGILVVALGAAFVKKNYYNTDYTPLGEGDDTSATTIRKLEARVLALGEEKASLEEAKASLEQEAKRHAEAQSASAAKTKRFSEQTSTLNMAIFVLEQKAKIQEEGHEEWVRKILQAARNRTDRVTELQTQLAEFQGKYDCYKEGQQSMFAEMLATHAAKVADLETKIEERDKAWKKLKGDLLSTVDTGDAGLVSLEEDMATMEIDTRAAKADLGIMKEYMTASSSQGVKKS